MPRRPARCCRPASTRSVWAPGPGRPARSPRAGSSRPRRRPRRPSRTPAPRCPAPSGSARPKAAGARSRSCAAGCRAVHRRARPRTRCPSTSARPRDAHPAALTHRAGRWQHRSRRPAKEFGMPEAVIVATARSPIGRAGKGSLVSVRPDDLAAQMVRAALDKVPQLDPEDLDDLMMGCGQPAGEAGNNIARAVAVELGACFLPGTTVNRYFSSSLQTSRMAFHAIKAGEGDAYISAGAEAAPPLGRGMADNGLARNPEFEPAWTRSDKVAAEGASEWHD